MDDDKTSYKSPYYADLSASASQRYGLPDGLLSAIVTRGERSNADQESSAGAKTVYQIIPATRDAALKKWGVDAYLSPENAADVAARLLKESLDRNKGAAPLAVAEYIGGTDPKQWGPQTRDYVKRVTGTPLAPASSPDVKASTFDRLMAARAVASTPSIANVVKAYQSGAMDPESRAEFEADVASGKLLLPRGVKLDIKPAAAPVEVQGGMTVPPGVIEAYQTGKMSPAEAHEFETDVAEGRVKVPQGTQIAKPQGIAGRAADAAMESVSGAQRETDTTRGLPDWTDLPELNSMSVASLKAAGGTLFAGPEEATKVLQAQFPGVQVRKDEKGNYVIKSSIDGGEYAIKPGFTWGDVPRAVGLIASFTPAGRAATAPLKGAAAAAGTEALIQGSQAATGGTFDTKDVAMAGAAGGAAPVLADAAGAVIEAAKPAVAAGVDAIRSRLPQVAARAAGGSEDALAAAARQAAGEVPPVQPAAAASGVPPVAAPEAPGAARAPASAEAPPIAPIAPELTVPPPVAPPVAPAAAAPTMTAEELAATARKASGGGFGSGKATVALAKETAPDAATVKAMDDLGFHYQPDHVTTNQAYRELAQAVKSVPGSETRAAELQMLEHNAGKADEIITQLGGTHDLSALNAKARETLGKAYADAKAKAKSLFDEIAARIDPVTPTPATDTLAFVQERARQLGGVENLSAGERGILAKLTPKGMDGDAAAAVHDGHISAADYAAASKGTLKQPTYALLDQERKLLNKAKYDNQNPFATMDSRLRDNLIEAMRADQGRVVETLGAGPAWEAANAATRVYKGIQDDLTSLFGKTLEGSIVGNLKNAIGTLSQGDVSRFVKLIQTIPQDMRKEVVASGLSSAFGKNARNGAINFNSYTKWFEGLQKNTVARDALFANLPPEAVQALTNLYKAAKGISMATRERITTGRIQAVSEEILKGDSLMGRVFDVAKRAGALEAVGSAIGLPGAGTAAAIASALTKGRTSAMRAADALINSPEFIAAARKASQQNIARLARSKSFTRFMRESKGPKDVKERERWIVGALQTKEAKK